MILARFLGYGLTFWPSFTCVCRLLLGWKDCPIKSMKQELFDIDFTSSVVFTISSCCNLGERVCSCLLLLGWKGCRLVYLFAVARGKVWLRLFSEGWAPVPPLPSLLSLLLLGVSLSICSWGGSACSSANLAPSIFRKSCFPLCTLCFPSHVIISYVAFLFLYSYRMKGLSLDHWCCIYLSNCC